MDDQRCCLQENCRAAPTAAAAATPKVVKGKAPLLLVQFPSFTWGVAKAGFEVPILLLQCRDYRHHRCLLLPSFNSCLWCCHFSYFLLYKHSKRSHISSMRHWHRILKWIPSQPGLLDSEALPDSRKKAAAKWQSICLVSSRPFCLQHHTHIQGSYLYSIYK